MWALRRLSDPEIFDSTDEISSGLNAANIKLNHTNMTDRTASAGEAVWSTPQIEISPVATPYQKVVGPFDVTEAGVPDVWSLFGDGLTSFISTVDSFTFNASGAAFAVAMQSEVKEGGSTDPRKAFAATSVETPNVTAWIEFASECWHRW